MQLPNIQTTGSQGISNGLENMRRDAQEIASATAKGGEDTADLAKSVVDLNMDRNQVEASVKVVQAANETVGTLLNTFA